MNDTSKEAASPNSQMPKMNFATFIFSLNHSALVHLGAVKDPTSGETVKDLALAKQTIEILSLLQEKTQGNLSEEETKMLESILYDLRIIYVREKG